MKTYPITCPIAGQTKPLPLTVDGINSDGALDGDGTSAPFYVFDQNNQKHVCGPYRSRWMAVLSARCFALRNGLEVTA